MAELINCQRCQKNDLLRIRWQGTFPGGRRIRIECFHCDGKFVRYVPDNDYYRKLATDNYVGAIDEYSPENRIEQDVEFRKLTTAIYRLIEARDDIDESMLVEAARAACGLRKKARKEVTVGESKEG